MHVDGPSRKNYLEAASVCLKMGDQKSTISHLISANKIMSKHIDILWSNGNLLQQRNDKLCVRIQELEDVIW